MTNAEKPQTYSPLVLSSLILSVAWSALAAPNANQATPPSRTQAESEEERRATAVATYDGGAVTVGEIEDTIADSSPLTQAHALEPASLREMLDRNLRFELELQEAERRGYRSDARIQAATKQNAVQLMISRDINAPLRAAPPSPEEARAYFESHREVFTLRELRRATELVVASEAQALELQPLLKAADSAGLRALVQQHGLATPSKTNGGDLRLFDATGTPESGDERVDTSTAKAVFALRAVGDVTAPIRRADGKLALLKLTELRAGHNPTFDEMKVRVRRRIEDERYEQAVEAITRAQRERLQPTVRYDLIDKLGAPIRLKRE